MERYENLGLVGEGSYGMVLKCRHKESNQIVAVKKFIESEDDLMVKKIAMREIKMLKLLRHENLVNLLEVFKRKKRVYLVFEFVDKTVLDDLEKQPDGLDELLVKRISFQVLRGLEFCHSHNVIHRDVKPENILVSNSGIVKLCDFGFARTLVTGPGEVFTDYVATRWYRSPELLVGDLDYGKAVDIWAVGCLLFEMITGDPLFPGDSDIDQLFHITKRLGNLTSKHQEIFHKNPLFIGMRLPNVKTPEPFWTKFPQLSKIASDLILKSLSLDASRRPSCYEMMNHKLYQEGNFATDFLDRLKVLIQRETAANPLLKSLAAQKDNNNESKQRSKKRRESKELIKKNLSELKKKKELKLLQKQNSLSTVQHTIVSSNTFGEGRKICNDFDSHSKRSNIDLNNEISLRDISIFKIKDSNISPGQHDSYNRFSDCDRSDTKLSIRTPLDLSINIPGKNLPELSYVANGNRNHVYDAKKHRNVYVKKASNKHESSALCLLTEKVPLHGEKNKIDDFALMEKPKRELSEIELPKVTGLVLPTVKGFEGRVQKLSPIKDARKPYMSTIPHIHNIDPFSTTTINNSETGGEVATGFNRNSKDGNLPAV